MSSTQIKNSVLIRTNNADQLGKLQRKLADYTTRYQYQAPEVDPGATYRYRILERLLTSPAGIIDLEEIEKEYAAKEWYNQYRFQEAVAIITAYNTGDLTLVRGGSGLR